MEGTRQTVLDIRLGLFDFEERIRQPENMWDTVREKMPGVFDKTPTIIPIDDVTENDGKWVACFQSTRGVSLNIARARADFFMTGHGIQTVDDLRMGFIGGSQQVTSLLSDQRARRIGLVVRAFYQTDSPHVMAANVLNNKIAAGEDGLLGDSVGAVAASYVVKRHLGELSLNDNTAVDSTTPANIGSIGLGLSGVLVVRDINIIQGMPWVATEDSVTSFLGSAFDLLHLNEIQSILWPTK